jgi:hypothetical protein
LTRIRSGCCAPPVICWLLTPRLKNLRGAATFSTAR